MDWYNVLYLLAPYLLAARAVGNFDRFPTRQRRSLDRRLPSLKISPLVTDNQAQHATFRPLKVRLCKGF